MVMRQMKSISAWVAKRVGAKRLVLVKSVGDQSTDVEAACKAEWVDSYFKTAAAGLRVEWRSRSRRDGACHLPPRSWCQPEAGRSLLH